MVHGIRIIGVSGSVTSVLFRLRHSLPDRSSHRYGALFLGYHTRHSFRRCSAVHKASSMESGKTDNYRGCYDGPKSMASFHQINSL